MSNPELKCAPTSSSLFISCLHQNLVNYLSRSLKISIVAIAQLLIFGFNHGLSAQIVPDDTLGTEKSVVTPENINGIDSDKITGGATRGSNLFHSFQEFNVGEGRGAYFDNPAAIQNIFSRVTGNNISDIQGVLGVLGDANLFLINPNGILFGNNARLDLEGSFLATTADSILFSDDNKFSALNPEAPPLLTVNVQQPVGLEFAGENGNITHRGNLVVEEGKNLALVGGDITLDTCCIVAPGGDVNLGGLTEVGIVNLNENGKLSFPDDVARGNITLTNGSLVQVASGGGGSITVNANNLEISGESQLLAGIGSNSGSVDSKAGDIVINATDKISLSDKSLIGNLVDSTGIGNAGEIKITATDISLTGESKIRSNTSGQGNTDGITFTTNKLSLAEGSQVKANTGSKGNAGEINIKASDTIEIDGSSSGIFSLTFSGSGNSGGINISTNNLDLKQGGQINSTTSGAGNAGKITINATESISIEGNNEVNEFNRIINESIKPGTGNLGGIEINTANLELKKNAVISTSSFAGENAGNININASKLFLTEASRISAIYAGDKKGNSGNISIKAEDLIALDSNSNIHSIVLSMQIGNAGNIDISTAKLSLNQGSQINNSILGQGNGGIITINASKLSLIDNGSQINSNNEISNTRDNGNAGDIRINTPQLFVNKEASISAFSNNVGNGGTITINAPQEIVIDNSSELTVETDDAGKPGDIFITTPNLTIGKDSQLSATATENSTNTESGGSITLNISNLDLTGKLGIFAETQGVSPAGTLDIQPYTEQTDLNIAFTDTAILSTQTRASGAGGDIRLTAPETINISGDGKISTETTDSGTAGDIDILAKDLNISNLTEISASTDGFGKAGNINITVDNLNLAQEAKIFTDTEGSLPGGDINLDIDDVLTLRTESKITAEAGNKQAGGNGGNINIDAPFIIALPNENSDIAADAFTGDGGKVNIVSEGIFGIEFRDQATELSDITASSEFGQQGEVEIDTSAVDPTRNIDSLPQQVTESEVVQTCQENGSQTTLEFFDIGRGGKPPTPDDILSSDVIIAEWIPLDLVEADIELSDLTQEEDSQVTSLNIFPCQDAQS